MSSDRHVLRLGGSPTEPHRFFEGPSEVRDDVRFRVRYFVYRTDDGLVVGRNTSQAFTIDRPARDVWPFIKDFNLWQNGYGYHYTGVVGDLEGADFYISAKFDTEKDDPNEPLRQTPYHVLKVVPEHLIVIYQPVPEDGSTGGVSPGFHTILLTERDGKTDVRIYTEHGSRTKDKSEEEALELYRSGGEETLKKFMDDFIPQLKHVIYEGT